MSDWYRQFLKAEVPALISTWVPRLGVEVNGFYVQRMKTRWGSCNPIAKTLRLNTELAKKPRACLEYIVVHEMNHMLERTHGPKFIAMMDRHMPAWREVRALLNGLPARHERWSPRATAPPQSKGKLNVPLRPSPARANPFRQRERTV